MFAAFKGNSNKCDKTAFAKLLVLHDNILQPNPSRHITRGN